MLSDSVSEIVPPMPSWGAVLYRKRAVSSSRKIEFTVLHQNVHFEQCGNRLLGVRFLLSTPTSFNFIFDQRKNCSIIVDSDAPERREILIGRMAFHDDIH